MTDPRHAPDLDIMLDAFGQRLIFIFTQISFCFRVDVDATIDSIEQVLRQGLVRLAESFPWVSGQVTCEGGTATSTGTFRIKALQALPHFVMRDLRLHPHFPSREQLAAQAYPMRKLPESQLAPRNTSSGRPGDVVAEVFQLQANVIDGGLILTFLGQHQALDGTGLAQVISLFSKACRGQAYSKEELETGNLSQRNTIPVYPDDWSPGSELRHNIIIEEHSQQAGPNTLPTVVPQDPGVWCHFNVSAESARELKALASQTMPLSVPYISTDDAISALLWQSVGRSRSTRLDESLKVNLARAVDLRPFLGISPAHPGFVQSMTYHTADLGHLTADALGVIAADLRAAVDPRTTTLSHHGQSFATLIKRTEDKSRTSYLAGFDMSRDLLLSSWANQNSYELDFGLGFGGPEAVRRPDFPSFPGLIYILPRSVSGEYGIAVCLEKWAMDNLVADEDFLRFAKPIG